MSYVLLNIVHVNHYLKYFSTHLINFNFIYHNEINDILKQILCSFFILINSLSVLIPLAQMFQYIYIHNTYMFPYSFIKIYFNLKWNTFSHNKDNSNYGI
jgi:hypothetical protein